jgi:hypothetical protein
MSGVQMREQDYLLIIGRQTVALEIAQNEIFRLQARVNELETVSRQDSDELASS